MKGVQFHASPVLAIKMPAWRSHFVIFLLFVGFMALILRALYLQGFSTDFLQTQGEMRYARTLDMPATRGKITDRNGVVLASSVPVLDLWAIPEDVDATPSEVASLAHLLDMPADELSKRFGDSNRKFVYLKRGVNQDTAEAVDHLNISGVHERKEFHRLYSQGETMAHVLGFTNVEDVGQEGLELSWEKQLAGSSGSRRVFKDRLGRVIEDVASIRAPHDGQDLTLSIDGQVQYLAFSHLKAAVEAHHAKAGAIVVVDVRTGEILALANLPTYNPNDRTDLTGAQLRNRVLTDTYEPGSTLKPFTISLALNEGVVTPQTIIDTAPGRFTIGTATISDSHAHGALSVEDIIKVSSNIGTAKIALKLQSEAMWQMFQSVGLGQAPHIGFPGAAAGRLRPYKSWRPIEQATMAYGYGLSVSLLQMARAYTIFARNGDMIPLTLFKTDTPAQGVQVIPPGIAAEMRHMLEAAAGPGGTAPKAQVVGYRVAGKTGTAHKLENGVYAGDRYVGSFVGFAPVSDPRIVVAVMIDEPTDGVYYGGDVAGPVFSAVVGGALRSLNVEPDSPIKSLIIPTGFSGGGPMSEARCEEVVQWLREQVPLSSHLSSDSRKLATGDVFLAYPGERFDARAFIGQAITRGAGALLYDDRDGFVAPEGIAARAVPSLKTDAGIIASLWYGEPSRRMFSIGVTGTSGKSTCALWLAQLFEALGHKSALVGTLGAGFLGQLTDTGHTTPDPVDVERLLSRLSTGGADVLAMEVTSVGIIEGRVNGLSFDVALFTNLSRDHLDYHGSMESYREAKAKLFAWAELMVGVVNLDDEAFAAMRAAMSDTTRLVTYSASGNPLADLYASHIEARDVGMRIGLKGRFGTRELVTAIVGRYNVDNLLGVLAVALAAGVDFEAALAALGKVTPAPGRLEPVHESIDATGPLVLVDYAHKPDALEKVLQACRPMAEQRQGKLIAVFGCGGDRDRGKRPLMGEIGARLADRLVLTSDNPRSETPGDILDEIVAGIPAQHHAEVLRVPDRRAAIETSVRDADLKDVVVIAGKGHEDYQEIEGVKSPFSDLLEARRVLTERRQAQTC